MQLKGIHIAFNYFLSLELDFYICDNLKPWGDGLIELSREFLRELY